MTIEQLQYFYTISETGTFSQAAIDMNITQSSLSKQIAKLEQELGIILFDRTHRQITLTYAGKRLLEDTKTILKDYKLMLDHLHVIRDKDAKTIRIAMLPILSQYNLARKISEFKKIHPDINILIHEIEEPDFLHKLDYHDHDIYILRTSYDKLPSFHQIQLYEDVLVAVVSLDHPLSKYDKINIQQLNNHNILLTPSYTRTSQLAIETCQNNGFTPHVIRHGRIETILSAANENEGIALVMKKSLDIFHFPHIKALSFHEDIHSDLQLFYTTDSQHYDTIHEFISFLQSHNKERAV